MRRFLLLGVVGLLLAGFAGGFCWSAQGVLGPLGDPASSPARLRVGPGRIAVAGQLEPSSLLPVAAAILLAAALDFDGRTQLSLNSTGGNLPVAIWLARILDALQHVTSIETRVGAGATCQSACTILFAAGGARVAAPDASFMFHASSLEAPAFDPADASRRQLRIEQIYLERLAHADAELVQRLKRHGAFDSVRPSFTTAAELRRAGLSFITALERRR